MWPFKKRKIEELSDLTEKILEFEKKIEGLEKKLEETKREQDFFIKKVGIFKFNALKTLGGNQSFALALLDEKDNGIVISNLVLREESRVFAKLIKNGKEQFYNNKKTASSYYFRTH
jgi:hypothetical protein